MGGQDRVDDADLLDGLELNYGTMFKTMCVLFEGISGGNDWAGLAENLRTIGDAYYLCFALYVVFVTLGVLNIVTGFFVDGTMQASANHKELMLREAQEKRNTMVEMLGELFVQLDKDRSGKISLEELETQLYDVDVQEYLCVLEIEPEEARDLFKMIDVDNSGEVKIEEFTNGCLKIMGTPRSFDILACLFQSKKIFASLETLLKNYSLK